MKKGPRSPMVSGALHPETAAGGLLPLLEAAAWSAGLPGAGRLAALAEARGFYRSTLFQQWEILHALLAEHAREASEPQDALCALFDAADPRVRFFVPGAWSRLAADGEPRAALAQLRVWAAGADALLADSVPAFGVRPWAERLGPDAVALLLPWAIDPDPEVRRAAVVALRPRGAWVPHLSWAVATPSLLVPLLDALRAEPDPRVAGALGNALNDVGHASPQLVLALLHRWREEEPGPQLGAIARRGLRGLLKAGDARALQALGLAELRVEASAVLRGPAEIVPNSGLVFDLEVRNLGEAGSAHLVYEIETPGKLAGRPRRQRVQAGTYLLPARDRVRLIVRERVFDRKAAPLVDGPGLARFFLNGAECAQASFRIRRG
jgi:3-methyladenine DNA glycosylase AlkC